MQRTQVVSSNLVSVGYDAASSMLEVEFNDGAIYQYFDVSQLVYEELMQAESHGVYFSANIRNDYRYVRL